MSAERAAERLSSHLRKYPWFLSVGVGENESGVVLYVYVKSKKHIELERLGKKWEDYDIIIRGVGTIRPVASQFMAYH